MKARPKIVIHNHYSKPARDADNYARRLGFDFAHNGSLDELKASPSFKSLSPEKQKIALDAYKKVRSGLIRGEDASGKFYLWGRPKDGGNWGRINPTSLSFASKAEGEAVKARYEARYPDQKFAVATDISAKDANTAYEVKVRQLATGSDFTIRIFAASQEDAEQRAKERARQAYKISPEKYRELGSKGIAVFRIVSSRVAPDQSRVSGLDARPYERPEPELLKRMDSAALSQLYKQQSESPLGKNHPLTVATKKELERRGMSLAPR